MADGLELPPADAVQQLIEQLQASVAALGATRARLEEENRAALTRLAKREATLDAMRDQLAATINQAQAHEVALLRMLESAEASLAANEAKADGVLEAARQKVDREVTRLSNEARGQLGLVSQALQQMQTTVAGTAKEAVAPVLSTLRGLDQRVAASSAAAKGDYQRSKAAMDRMAAEIRTTLSQYAARSDALEGRVKKLTAVQAQQAEALEEVRVEQTKPIFKKKFF